MISAFALVPRSVFTAIWLFTLPAAPPASSLHGTTTTERGAVRLPGVEVAVTDTERGERTAIAISDGNGRFEVRNLPAGRYQVVARLAGFSDFTSAPITLAEGRAAEVNLDLSLAPVTEEVKVEGQAGFIQTETSVSRDRVKGDMIDILPVAGDGYRALLPVLPGVVRAPDGRISLKGARETQGALQVGRGYANDPSTGNFGIELPADSIDSVDVVPNPYGAEDGRFSSAVVRIETRAASNDWSAVINGFLPIPCLRLCDGSSLGVRNYKPRGWFGGPLVKDRLFLAQGVQFRYAKVRVPSLPEPANDTTDYGIETFTRLDANLAAGHQLSATVSYFPRRTDGVNLNTFTPAEVAPDFRLMGYGVAVSESSTLSPTLVVESSLTTTVYNADVLGDGNLPHEFTVDGARGNFFNTQERRTHAIQWTEAITTVRRGATGEHMVRAGTDLMWAAYRGTSASRPVTVRRRDGTLSQRFDFGGPTAQRVSGADLAVFVQDRWRLNSRLAFEPGLRVERDGVPRRMNLSPRVGFVAGLLRGDAGVLRGGIGVFYERTPLNVGAFESFEPFSLTRFASDGTTPLAPPVTFSLRASPLQTPRSVVWNMEYDQRFGSNVFVKLNHMRREGRNLAIVEPLESPATSELHLDSHGRSRYAETELTLRYGASELRQLGVAYVRSHSTANLNAFDAHFGNFREPIVRPDEYSLVPTDVPNRVLVRGTFTVRNWTFSALLEARNGFPYSVVDEDQEYVGLRNRGGRFPNMRTLDISVVRSATFLNRPVRFGVRVYHLLNSFEPRDVQNNIDSPAFGTFYNSIPRRLGVTFTFLPR